MWSATTANSTASVLCPNGPNNTMATRECLSNGIWSEPNIQSCATVLTQEFRRIGQVSNVLLYTHCIIE